MANQTLQWTQLSWKHRRYELKEGDELLATLDYRGKWKTVPTLILDGDELVFKSLGFFKSGVVVQRGGVEIATCAAKLRQTEIRFVNGRIFRGKWKGFWSREYVIADAENEALMTFKSAARWFRSGATITLAPAASNYPELRVLAAIAWYVMIASAEASTLAAT